MDKTIKVGDVVRVNEGVKYYITCPGSLGVVTDITFDDHFNITYVYIKPLLKSGWGVSNYYNYSVQLVSTNTITKFNLCKLARLIYGIQTR